MRVLLGSGGIGTEERTARFKGLLTEHFEGCGRILFIPLATANHQDRVIKMRDLLGMNESNLVLIDQSRALELFNWNTFLHHKRVGVIQKIITRFVEEVAVSEIQVRRGPYTITGIRRWKF